MTNITLPEVSAYNPALETALSEKFFSAPSPAASKHKALLEPSLYKPAAPATAKASEPKSAESLETKLITWESIRKGLEETGYWTKTHLDLLLPALGSFLSANLAPDTKQATLSIEGYGAQVMMLYGDDMIKLLEKAGADKGAIDRIKKFKGQIANGGIGTLLSTINQLMKDGKLNIFKTTPEQRKILELYLKTSGLEGLPEDAVNLYTTMLAASEFVNTNGLLQLRGKINHDQLALNTLLKDDAYMPEALGKTRQAFAKTAKTTTEAFDSAKYLPQTAQTGANQMIDYK